MEKGKIFLRNRTNSSLSTRLRTQLKFVGAGLLIIAILAGIFGVKATYSISGHVFIDYDEDLTENGEDTRLPIMKVSVYSDEDASGDLSAGDFEIDSDISNAIGEYSIEFSTGSNNLTYRVSHANDDAEENTSTDGISRSSSDLEMFYDGSTHQIIGIRFDSVDLPKSAVITSAYLRFESKSSSAANTINIYGELSPSSNRFTSGDRNISDRAQTTQSVAWGTSSWTSGSFYNSDDLTAIVEEIRNQTYWATKNPMAFILEGTSGTKNAYSGTTRGPQLVINYTMPLLSNDFIIALDSIHLVSGSRFSETVTPLGSTSNQAVSYTGEGVLCFAVADDGDDQFMIMNRVSGLNRIPFNDGATGATEIEAVCFNPGGKTLYTADGGTLGTLNLTTGTYTSKPSSIGTGNGSLGAITFSDIDGLSFNSLTGELWASNRRSSATDLLLKIDTASGQFVADAFGTGVDYVNITGTGIFNDIDDIAVNPDNGRLYATNNGGGSYEFLVEINTNTGAASIIDTLKLNSTYLKDVEGFGFTNFGLLLATTGNQGNLQTSNGIYEIDLSTAAATSIGVFDIAEDFEGCDCLIGANNTLSGYVYEDINKNQIFDGGESVFANNKLRIYIDVNQNGSLDGGDQIVDSILTNPSGYYSWSTASNLDFLIEIDTLSMPTNFDRTSSGEESSLFSTNYGGKSDLGNNFGILDETLFPVVWKSFSGNWLNGLVELRWETSLKINTQSFLIERSLDGNIFEFIGQITAAGNSEQGETYRYQDDGIKSLQGSPHYYYRLKQLDINGQFTYSRVLSLSSQESRHLEFTLFPNPASNEVQLDFDGTAYKDVQIQILNQLGQLVIQRNLPSKQISNYTFKVADWAPGVYSIVLTSTGHQARRKLIVK